MAKVADGIRYAERVVAGEIVAGEFVRLACQRFLDDLKYGEERGIYFSEPRAQHILNFYKFVPHVKGALAGQPIELMDWHVFILINIFGFVIPLVNEETHATDAAGSARGGESFWHWALGADGGHGHAQPPFRSSRLIGAERQPTSDCRQSLQQSPPC